MPFFCPPDKHPHAGRDLVRLPREEGLLLGHCWDGEVQEGRHVERRAQPHAHHINLEVVHMAILYRADGICWVKGSVCFVLKFAFPPISDLSPLKRKFQNKTRTEPLTTEITSTLYVLSSIWTGTRTTLSPSCLMRSVGAPVGPKFETELSGKGKGIAPEGWTEGRRRLSFSHSKSEMK